MRVFIPALISLFLLSGHAHAQTGGVTIDKIKVMAAGANNYRIEVTGMVAGSNDDYRGIMTFFKDPTGAEQVPFINFTPPAPGKTSPYVAFLTTSTKGDWSFT